MDTPIIEFVWPDHFADHFKSDFTLARVEHQRKVSSASNFTFTWARAGWGLGPGLSLRAGGQGFSPATASLSPGYFDTKRKYRKEKNAWNYKIMN